jgi:hypothetical protein
MPTTRGGPYGPTGRTHDDTYHLPEGPISPVAPGAMPDLVGPPGLRVWFYRPAHGRDDTGGGLSAAHEQATITGVIAFDPLRGLAPLRPLAPGFQIARPTADAPAVWLVRNTAPGSSVVFLVPAGRPIIDGIADLTGVSFGGNFAFSPDPLLIRLTGTTTAVPVHDRLPGGSR